nr:PREDICTED: 1-acyl-sn-glycerol-3-phosphate acyltransferase epsilon [Bos mutus]
MKTPSSPQQLRTAHHSSSATERMPSYVITFGDTRQPSGRPVNEKRRPGFGTWRPPWSGQRASIWGEHVLGDEKPEGVEHTVFSFTHGQPAKEIPEIRVVGRPLKPTCAQSPTTGYTATQIHSATRTHSTARLQPVTASLPRARPRSGAGLRDLWNMHSSLNRAVHAAGQQMRFNRLQRSTNQEANSCRGTPPPAGDYSNGRPIGKRVVGVEPRPRPGQRVMGLSLVLHMHSVRCVLPAAVLLGTAPTYVLVWGAWRLLSALLPSRFYQAVDDRLYCVYQSMVLFFFENYTGLQILLYGDLPKNKENIIYLANHQSTVDWIIADILAVRQSALGHVRYVLKDGLKWLPLYGCYFSQHGGIYVKRSAKFNENQMRKKLQRYINAGTPMYLVIFPEGTRYNPELTKVISASQAFAAQEGLPVLKHVLTPRIKATHVAFDSMKDYLDAVYDVTVAFEGSVDDKGQRKEAPSMAEFLCKECPKIHIHIDRIDKKNIPEEQVSMKRWLHERFEIKDKLLIEFYDSPDPERRNKFPGESVNSKLSLKKTLPSFLILSGLTAGLLMTEAGRKLYVKTWIYGTLIGCLWVSIKA